jgi:hypothetical protein
MRARTPTLAAIVALALLVGACTVTILPDDGSTVVRPTPPNDVARPTPRPEPSPELPSDAAFSRFEVGPLTIYPSSQIFFRARVRDAGYLTVSVMAPNGRVSMLATDVPIEAGRQLLYPPSGGGTRIQASAPEGVWQVRAEWTPRPTNARYQGIQGRDDWTAAILRNLAGVAGASVVETSYEVSVR